MARKQRVSPLQLESDTELMMGHINIILSIVSSNQVVYPSSSVRASAGRCDSSSAIGKHFSENEDI